MISNLKDKVLIGQQEQARSALQLLNDLAIPGLALFVTDDKRKIVGSVTDGDIRRALLAGAGMETILAEIANKKFRFLSEGKNDNLLLESFRKLNIRFVPVLNEEHFLTSLIDLEKVRGILPVEALLMAGGKGERLRPLTENLPKPLLKVGEMPIIERNIERLASYSVQRFHISLGYLGDKIESFLGDGSKYHSKIDYIREDVPMGTIGALKLAKGIEKDVVLIMNSDLLTNIDFADFYNYFESSDADMVMATVPYHVDVPYAVIETDDGQVVTSFTEKPRYTYYSNAGIYLLKKKLIDLIPDGQKFDATDLMELVIAKKLKLKSFPIVGYWLDIGRMEDYNKAQEDIKHIKF